jgi:hypothetical protein
LLSTHRQPLAPLGAPALKHQLAAFARHPFPEAVRLFSLAVIGLERPFHDADLSTLPLRPEYQKHKS